MRQQKRRQVLVVDDDPSIRRIINVNLEAEGMEVSEVATGSAVLPAARRLRPDLIILDVTLPGIDGLGVMAGLKADPALARIPVVLLTGRASDADIWRGWQAGADYYLTKPFEMSQLVHFIDNLFPDRRTPRKAGRR